MVPVGGGTVGRGPGRSGAVWGSRGRAGGGCWNGPWRGDRAPSIDVPGRPSVELVAPVRPVDPAASVLAHHLEGDRSGGPAGLDRERRLVRVRRDLRRRDAP